MHLLAKLISNEELNLLGYKSQDSYAKTGSYVTSGNVTYIHTRGFDFGDSVDPEQVLKVTLVQIKLPR